MGIISTFQEMMPIATDLIKAKLEQSRQAINVQAQELSNPVQKAENDPKSIFFDPYSIVEQFGYKDRPSSITYATLWNIFCKLPIVQAIVFLRMNQVAAFATPQQDKFSLGFRVVLKDKDKNTTKQEQKFIAQMNNVLLNTGVTNNPRGRDSFKTFLKKLVFDTLIYDQMCFEIVPNRKGTPAEWYATDAATIRIADNGNVFNDEDKTKEIRYVQVYDGVVINEYTQYEMVFGVRHPNTNIRLQGYGVSELELLVSTITSLLYGHQYNQKFFTQGSSAKGILNFKGTTNAKQFAEFKRHWYNLLSSVNNAWKTPITNTDGIEWINMQQTHRDMEFSAWMDFLIKEASAVYATDPAEINFNYGNTGQSRALVESSSAEKIIESKERGLRPLLNDIGELVSIHIVEPINSDFTFEFMGLDAETKDAVATRNQKRVQTYITVNELRAEEDRPPLPDGQGDIILNQVYIQNKQQTQAMQQQEEGDQNENGMTQDDNEEGGNGEQDIRSLLSKYSEDDLVDQNEEDGEVKKSLILDVVL
jgi:phage portal protein BeeE